MTCPNSVASQEYSSAAGYEDKNSFNLRKEKHEMFLQMDVEVKVFVISISPGCSSFCSVRGLLFDGGLKNTLSLKSELCSSWPLVGLFKLPFITIEKKTRKQHVHFIIRIECPKEVYLFVHSDQAQ